MKKLRAGSRESRLAVIQTELVMEAIRTQDPACEIELVTMKTTGDKILDRTLDKVGGKGLFVKELDAALLDGLTRCAQPWSVSGPAQAAGLAALRTPLHPFLARQLIAVERTWLTGALRSLGLKAFPSLVNYILFRAEGVDDLKERLLEHGVLIRSCANYVGLGSDYYRVAVRLRQENEGLIKALKEVL